MAVSASSSKFWIQSFGLSCKLYLGPFYSKAISGSEKDMSVMFTTRGWKLLLGRSLCVCCCVWCLILLSRALYLILHCFWSLFSMSCCMCGHRFFHRLASFKCVW